MMPATLEDLRVLRAAESIADEIWKRVMRWDEFARDVVGKQLARAADSVGANIAESFGRFNFGEKLQFLYYSRGSLFETKYWLNRARARDLINETEVREYVDRLTKLARELNSLAGSLKIVRAKTPKQKPSSILRESAPEYSVSGSVGFSEDLFSAEDLAWLNA